MRKFKTASGIGKWKHSQLYTAQINEFDDQIEKVNYLS